MSKKQTSHLLLFRALTVVFPVAAHVLFFHGTLVESSVFFTVGAGYGVLLYRVGSLSARASFVMNWAGRLALISVLGVQSALQVPAAGPMLMGYIAGAIAGGHLWTGKRAGSELKRKRERVPGGGYTGGWHLALINAVCASVLLGFPWIFLLDGATPRTILISIAVGFLGGWSLYRFAKTSQVEFMTLLGVFLAFLPALIVAGSLGYGAAPVIAVFGMMAGILIGGRHWWGSKLGAPRPPFNVQGKRRRRKKRKTKPKPTKPAIPALQDVGV